MWKNNLIVFEQGVLVFIILKLQGCFRSFELQQPQRIRLNTKKSHEIFCQSDRSRDMIDTY
jgi:hypothetical protein